MSIPNLYNTVRRKSIKLNLYRITEEIINYVPQKTEALFIIDGMIKPLMLSDVIKSEIDYNLKYKHIVALQRINIDDIVEFKSVRYRCYSNADYEKYGFYKADLEEVK